MDRPVRLAVGAALSVYLLGLLAAALAAWRQPPTAVAAASDAGPPVVRAAAVVGDEPAPLVGFALNLHHTEHLPRYLESIEQVAKLGCNSLQVVTPMFQRDGADEQVVLLEGPGRGPTRQQLLDVLQHARRHGLRTVLMPIVLFTHPRGNEWRGKITPNRWDPWWHSYRQAIDAFVDVAVEARVDAFCIGSELLSTERQVERWHELVQHVRRRYDGRLIYSTNWDHFQVPTLWQQMDLIGISGYWNLEQGASQNPPTDADLDRRWGQIRQQVLDFGREQGKPILITELGYPSLPWGLRDPWNYINKQGLPADHATQARGYRSFIRNFSDLLPHGNPRVLGGVFFYAWDPYRQGDAYDTGYGVRGKPAMDVVERWLSGEAGRKSDNRNPKTE